MTSSPSDGSSDLEKARTLSKRLGPASPPDVRPGGFIVFRRPARHAVGAFPPPSPPQAAAVGGLSGVQTSPPMLPAFGARRWDLLTAWLRESVDGRAAFVMDSQGLLMALDGPLEVPEVENAGARLGLALLHAGKMFAESPPFLRLDVSVGDLHLTGFELHEPGGSQFTVGILGPEPISPRRCAALRRQAESALATDPDPATGPEAG
ncbi:MAG: hypothetical protein IPL90_18685 [Holophagales bacterium]|nr:hypothetical protein [Holophagales bacterium]